MTNDQMAVLWHGTAYLPKLRLLPREEVQAIALAASDLSMSTPLHLAGSRKFDVKGWGQASGSQVTALMVFGLWVLCGEDEEKAAPLLADWPIKEVLIFTGEIASSDFIQARIDN